MLAVLAPIFGIFAVKPVESEIIGSIDKVLLTYDTETLERLQQAKKEEEKLRQFIEYKSNEIFLVKLRSYFEASIISKYEGSEIEKLIVDLEVVETQLDTLKVPYDELQLPERFKKIVEEVSKRNRAEEQLSFYKSVARTLPLPRTFTRLIESVLAVSFRWPSF